MIAENEISIKTIEGNESTEKNNTRQQTLDKPEAFIQLVWPHVVRGAQKLGVDPKVLVAQAALETGWGTSITKNEQGKPSYNLFNIKADRRWQGKTTETMTTEYENNKAVRKKENFRSYLNIAESVDDYVSFIKENPRYHQALKQASNPQAYMEAIHQAGYATDPKYHQKVMSIYEGARLNNGVDWLKQRSLSLKI